MSRTTRIELVDSGVIFNPNDHTYELNGNYLSGITELLQRQLFPNEYANVPKAILQQAALYGNSVHLSCQDFDSRWYNDGSIELMDYIQLCQEHSLTHEASEYTVTDFENYASNIDKVFRVTDNTFDLADLKTYGKMTPEKLEKALRASEQKGENEESIYPPHPQQAKERWEFRPHFKSYPSQTHPVRNLQRVIGCRP